MEKFAKVFDTPKTQLLVYMEADEEGQPRLVRKIFMNGVVTGHNLIWPDDDNGWVTVKKIFDLLDQESAEYMVETILKELDRLGLNISAVTNETGK